MLAKKSKDTKAEKSVKATKVDAKKPAKVAKSEPKKKKVVTKSSQIQSYLKSHKRIDSWTAITKFGATRLSAIIFGLRKKGWEIDTEMVSKKDRNGNVCNFAVYRLVSYPQ